MPEISVIMPVYNGEKYLPAAVESILRQSFTDFELIAINDGSTDRTGAVLKKYSRLDNRLIIINNKKRLGVARSLNRGLKRAGGRYIARMDGDDISEKERFKVQKSFLDKHTGISMVGTWSVFIDERGNYLRPFTPFCNHEDLYNVIIAFVPFSHGSVMMRSGVFDQKHIKGYNSFYETAEDYDLWVKMMEYHRVANIPEFLYKYRTHKQPRDKSRLQQEKSELIRLNAVRNRGSDFKQAMEFSDNWAYRCFYYNYGELLRKRAVVVCSNDNYLTRRTIELVRQFDCEVYGVLREDLSALNREYSSLAGYEAADLLQMEEVTFIAASWYWKEIKDRLMNGHKVEEGRIVYSFYL